MKVSFGCKEENKRASLRTAFNSVHSASGATNKNKHMSLTCGFQKNNNK